MNLAVSEEHNKDSPTLVLRSNIVKPKSLCENARQSLENLNKRSSMTFSEGR